MEKGEKKIMEVTGRCVKRETERKCSMTEREKRKRMMRGRRNGVK